MRRIRFLLLTALCAALLLIICAAPACAVTYADGDYTVPFSMEGLGRHNIAWSTATVHVEGGALFVDFTVERVDPRNHAPQFDWLQTPAGTATPILNDETYTATFLRVPVPDLGRVDVTVQSSGMSAPVLLDYTIVIDGSRHPGGERRDAVAGAVACPDTDPGCRAGSDACPHAGTDAHAGAAGGDRVRAESGARPGTDTVARARPCPGGHRDAQDGTCARTLRTPGAGDRDRRGDPGENRKRRNDCLDRRHRRRRHWRRRRPCPAEEEMICLPLHGKNVRPGLRAAPHVYHAEKP